MADSVKKQQGKTGKPGRPKGSTTKKETAGSSRAKKQNTVSAGRSSSSRKVQEPVYEEDDMGFMRAEVIIICSFAVAILLFLSNFGLCGIVGEILKGMQLGLFGILGYLLPLLIFIGTCFYLSNQGNIHAAGKLSSDSRSAYTVRPVSAAFWKNASGWSCYPVLYRWSSRRRRRWINRRSVSFSTYVFCRKSRRLSCIFSTAYYLYGMYYREILCVCGEAGQ